MIKLPDGKYGIYTIDCHYGTSQVACAYLLVEDGRGAFIDNNTVHAVPFLLRALSDHGMTPEQVELVIITHLHLDHAGGTSALLQECSKAVVVSHPRAARHIIDPARLVSASIAVYGEQHFREMYGEITPVAAARVRTMGDGETIEFGGRKLTFIHTAGHASHHFCIHDSVSNGVFTGDAFGLAYPMVQRGRRPFIFPTTAPSEFNLEEARASVEKLLATDASHAYLTHFGAYHDIKEGAGQLSAAFDLIGHIASSAVAAGIDGGRLEAYCYDRFSEFVSRELFTRGILLSSDEKDLLDMDVRLNAKGIAQYISNSRGEIN